MTIDYSQFSGKELDTAVAEAFGWKQRSDGYWSENTTDENDENDKVFGVMFTWDSCDYEIPIFSPSRKAGHLEYVKRAIESRGWRWRCAAYSSGSLFTFRVSMQIDPDWDKSEEIGVASRKTEQRAGCEAFLGAIEYEHTGNS